MQYELIKPEIVDRWVYSDCEENKICPVNFRLKHKELLQRAHRILSKRRIKIDPRFSKLTTSLRTATSKGDWDLDKTATSHSDVLDSYMLAQMPILFNDNSS